MGCLWTKYFFQAVSSGCCTDRCHGWFPAKHSGKDLQTNFCPTVFPAKATVLRLIRSPCRQPRPFQPRGLGGRSCTNKRSCIPRSAWCEEHIIPLTCGFLMPPHCPLSPACQVFGDLAAGCILILQEGMLNPQEWKPLLIWTKKVFSFFCSLWPMENIGSCGRRKTSTTSFFTQFWLPGLLSPCKQLRKWHDLTSCHVLSP